MRFHSSLCGTVLEGSTGSGESARPLAVFEGLADLLCGDSLALKRVGAEGLILRAMRSKLSVNTSAANLQREIIIFSI